MFPVIKHPGFMTIMPSFLPFSIVFSNQRFSNCSCTLVVGFVKLLSNWFCGNKVFKMNIEFCRHLCCSSSMIFRHNPLQCTMIPFTQFVYRPLFLLADDVFPWFVYWKLLLLIHIQKWPFWLQMLQLHAYQPSVHFEILTSLPYCGTFIWTVTQHNL